MKIRLTSYTFDASEKTVTAGAFSDVTLAGIQLIVNVTDQIIIYNFADSAKGGTLSTDTLTLEYDTTSMSDTDELMILVEDGVVQALPSGAATSAKQDTMIGHLDGVEGLLTTIDGRVDGIEGILTTIDADTGNISTKIDTIAGAVSGSEMQVDIVTSALPTGAATSAKQDTEISHLATIAGDTTDIEAAVELIDDTVVVLGTDTYTEATSKGLVIGGVRRDADTTLVNTTNEFAPFQLDANGRLKVEIFDSGDSHTVDNAGTFAVQVDGNALTSLQLIDDVVYTDDTSTHSTGSSKGVGIMAVATATDASVNANDIGMVGMTTDRKLHVAVMDALPAGSAAIGKLAANSGVDIGDVDVTSVSAFAPATGASSILKAEDVARAGGDALVGVALARLDTPVANANVSNDGDYTNFLGDNFGKLWVTGTVPEDTAHVAGEALVVNGVRRIDTPAVSAGSSGDWTTMDASAEGAVWTTNTPTTTGGCSTFMASGSDGSSILVATKQTIKASAGNLYGYYMYNPEAAVTFVHFYNTDTVTVGTTNPQMTIAVPAGAGANLTFTYPVSFSTAISTAATTTAGGNTAPATGVSLVAWYK